MTGAWPEREVGVKPLPRLPRSLGHREARHERDKP
jgi:hypothetical protein